MSEIFSVQLTAAATAVLAAFAIVTAVYARKAFVKQSQEVAEIERQVADQQELTRQQGTLIEIQTGQLEALRGQLEEQQKASAAQAEVLRLQAEELRESLKERKRQAELGRGYQARRVFLTEESFRGRKNGRGSGMIGGIGTKPPSVTATTHSTSDQPIYNVEFHWHKGVAAHGEPELAGTVLPEQHVTCSADFPDGTNMELSGATVRFTDAAGVRWIRRPDGYLAEEP